MINPVAYWLHLPPSHGIHPVITIVHLEKYKDLPNTFDSQPKKESNREILNKLPETEVEHILQKKYIKRGQGRVPYFLVRWKGFGAVHDEWISSSAMKNAPRLVQEWEDKALKKVEGSDTRCIQSITGQNIVFNNASMEMIRKSHPLKVLADAQLASCRSLGQLYEDQHVSRQSSCKELFPLLVSNREVKTSLIWTESSTHHCCIYSPTSTSQTPVPRQFSQCLSRFMIPQCLLFYLFFTFCIFSLPLLQITYLLSIWILPLPWML
jgi:hypothetical protein